MRRLLANEVKVAAAVLAQIPEVERKRACLLWIDRADWAHKYMKSHGKPHHTWGNGSLLGAIGGCEVLTFNYSLADHCSAMEMLLHHLVKRKSRAY